MCGSPFEILYALHDPVSWVTVNEQMHMIRHDFHFQDLKIMGSRDILKGFLQTFINAVYKYLPPVLWTEDDMVAAQILQVC